MPYATNDGVRIYYEREGSGPPLVLHHGFSMSLERWRTAGYVDALTRDYDLILMDSRGHGTSDKPHDPAAYAIATRVADVVAVLDAAGIDRALFWGYSMGGMVGDALAHHAPERFRALIIGGWSSGPSPLLVEWSRQTAELLRSQGIAAYVEGYERATGMAEPLLRQRLLANDAEALAACVSAMGDQPIFTDSLRTPTIPMLVYAGDRDPHHERASAAAVGLPQITFVTLPGLTHTEASRRSDLVLPHVRAFLTILAGTPLAQG